jgi:preprotein translocase subunit SecE
MNMNDEARQTTGEATAADTAKMVVAIALAVGGIVAYYLLKSRPEAWASWVAMFGGLLLGLVVFGISQHGRDFWQFVIDSRVELRKVFWPTRQETFTTTLVVLVFVIVAAAFFWLLDLTLASVTKFFTGQGS